MARELSLNFREAINASETGEVPIFLVTLTHASFPSPIRLSTDPTARISDVPLIYGTVSRGQTYYFLPMSVVLPDERDGAPPRSQIRISNISQQIGIAMRSLSSPAKGKLELVLASALDDVEVSSPLMDVIAAGLTPAELTLQLTLNSMTEELYPTDTFNPAYFPAMFR